jgi:DNA repair exonuclease SbcCD ATPase subunit
MNLIGKILTLLILLMSIFFFATALILGAAQRNWKAEAAAMEARAAIAERQVNEAKSSTKEQLMIIEREKVARAAQIAVLNSQLAAAREQLDERTRLLREETKQSQERIVLLRESEARLAQQDDELKALRARNNELAVNIADQVATVKNLTLETFEQTTQIETLQKTIADLNSSLAKKTKVMNGLGVDDDYQIRDIVPKITAVVNEISDNGDFIAIKVGSDDGLRLGHVLDIYRNDRYIGRAEVTKVRPDISVLKALAGFMQSNVQEGDYVTSTL